MQRRARHSVHVLSEAALGQLQTAHPALCGDAPHRAVLPNLIDGTMLLGHQGHAIKLSEWAHHMKVAGVINLAPDHVPSAPEALPPHLAPFYVDVRHTDGSVLTDKPGDGRRLLDVLPSILDTIEAAMAHGRVFVHCAQGRSRSGSVAAAYLLRTHPGWSLFDALAFLAARRPEIELLPDYALALEQWAVGIGRPPSIERVASLLSRQLRGPLGLAK